MWQSGHQGSRRVTRALQVRKYWIQLQKLFLLEQDLTSKSCATLRQAFSGQYPDKEVLNKTAVHGLVTNFWATGSVWSRKCVWYPAVYIDTCAIATEILRPLPQESGIFVTSTRQATKGTKLCTTFHSLMIPLKWIKRRDSYSSSYTTSTLLTFRRRIKSRLPFAGIIRRLPYSTRFQDKG